MANKWGNSWQNWRGYNQNPSKPHYGHHDSSWHKWKRPENDKESDSKDDDETMRHEPSSDAGGVASGSNKGKKRQKPDDAEETERQSTWKVFSQASGNIPINVDGNKIQREDVMTVQQPPDFISMTNQAMWLILEEPIEASYYTPWMRPATRLSNELENQYQSNQGLRQCKLEHQNAKGQTSTTHYDHDLRSQPWIQRKFKDETRKEIVSEKEIHRITLS